MWQFDLRVSPAASQLLADSLTCASLASDEGAPRIGGRLAKPMREKRVCWNFIVGMVQSKLPRIELLFCGLSNR